MRRVVLLFVVLSAVAWLPGRTARAEDSVRLSQSSSLIGEHILMQVQVTAPEGATVELTPGTESWMGVDLVQVESVSQTPQAEGVLWFIEARVAPFLPGNLEFAPTVSVIQGSEATTLVLPPVRLAVVWTLPADAELVLTPLAPPVEIPGAESPWLRPAMAGSVLVGCVLLAAVIYVVGRWAGRAMRNTPEVVAIPQVPATLEGAEQLIDSDPVGAYRLMSSVVKTELAKRYGVRATALTTTELRRRLESGGDRWQARLVYGLLEECDSVIYAGYRPAAERRQADLTMAREIVEVAG